MTSAYLNLIGFLVAAAGSTIAMCGVFKQANGYYAFKAGVLIFAETVLRLCRTFVLRGKQKAFEHVVETYNQDDRKEDRVQSLIGFYAVFIGFLLQLIGSTILYTSTLISSTDAMRCGK